MGMRLIDADALEYSLGVSDTDIEIKETLREAPTVDAVPIDIVCSALGELGRPPCLGMCSECKNRESAATCWRGYITKLMEE